MRRNGVVVKLFAVTSALIIIVFALVLLAEGLFFERFYRATKLGAIERNMSELAEQLRQTEPRGQQLARMIGAFMNHNDASAAILNGRLERVTVHPYFFELSVDGKTVTVLLPANGTMADSVPRGLQVGDPVTVDGIYMDEADTILHPVALQPPPSSSPGQGLVRVQGAVTDVMLPARRSYNPFYQDSLLEDALRDWKSQTGATPTVQRQGTAERLEWADPWSGVPYAVLVRSLPANGGEDRYLFVMASMQPVGEAVAVLQRYFVYLAPVIIVLTAGLALIYSRIVSRPLIALNRTAERLAKLDFAAMPEVRSNDEFGELARHMTAMSRNLDAALAELTGANAQLREDMREKQRSERLRKELIANLSHELKTPLGIVKGFAEGLQDGVAEDKKDRYLALIVQETDRMNAIIMDMLELSRFEVKAVRLQLEDVSIARLMRSAIDSFSHQLDSKGLQVKVNVDAEDAERRVAADPARIEQVIRNLLSNAVRHAEDNSVIEARVKRTAPGRVTVSIDNAGPPIAEEDLDRIWDHFYRAERSRDRKSGGTGLGLAIVKHILELHGSEFGAANTEHGVTFFFTLNEIEGDVNDEP